MRQGEHHGRGRHGVHHGHRHHGAQTFRRGRALEFLQRLHVKRETLVQQLSQTELQALHQVITGELKAVDMVINEFVEFFDLHEGRNEEKERAEDASAGSSEDEQKGGGDIDAEDDQSGE